MMGWLKHWFRQIKQWPSWLFWLPTMVIRLYLLCMRRQVSNPYGNVLEKGNWVTIVWHNRLLFYPPMFTRKALSRTVGVVSASRDGQYMAEMLAQFGVRSVRGSSRRKGAIALRGALKLLRQGNIVCVTPDGPRGPRYRMSLGPVILASRTGAPVLPTTVISSSHWCLRTWDRFRIPKPFAKIVLVVGEGIIIPPDLSEEEMERWRQILEQRLNQLSGVTGPDDE